MSTLKDMIFDLSEANGTPGEEGEISNIIEKYVSKFAEVKKDKFGNVTADMPAGEKTVLLDAHTDRIGMIVTGIEDGGFLRVAKCGGTDARVLAAQDVTVWGKEPVYGVVTSTPPHLSTPEDVKKAKDFDAILIDTGMTKEAAEKLISQGDRITVRCPHGEMENGRIFGAALDDRAGCAILINMIKSDLPYDMYFNFATGEEVGLGSAGTAAYRVNPDYAIVVETTTAADLADVPENKKVCKLGEGAVISFMDRRTIYSRELFDKAFELAKRDGIKAQVKSAVAGGNNAGVIHKTAGGIKTVTVSMPCRYLHSPSCVLKAEDITESERIIRALAEEFADA